MSEKARKNLLLQLEERLAAEPERPLPWPAASALSLLSGIYHGLYFLDRLPYRLGLRHSVHPGVPVISLGNLAVGGIGKTPAVIWLARALRAAGRRPVVLAHGYRSRTDRPLVVSTGNGETPAAGAGDEARLIALSCPDVPVVAGRDRPAAATLAVGRFHPDVLVADDAFQHWRLARDLDLVLLDAARPFDNGRLLPRGRLREPRAALRRAHALVLVGEDPRPLAADKPVFSAIISPAGLTRWDDWICGRRLPIDRTVPEAAAAFCGLARPERFFATLRALDIQPDKRLVLADHRAPAPELLAQWLDGFTGRIYTTEKDAVKLAAEPAGILQAQGRELWVLGVEFRPGDERALLDFILNRLNKGG